MPFVFLRLTQKKNVGLLFFNLKKHVFDFIMKVEAPTTKKNRWFCKKTKTKTNKHRLEETLWNISIITEDYSHTEKTLFNT